MSDTDPDFVDDLRELYALHDAITDSGGTLTPAVDRAIDALRRVWAIKLTNAERGQR